MAKSTRKKNASPKKPPKATDYSLDEEMSGQMVNEPMVAYGTDALHTDMMAAYYKSEFTHDWPLVPAAKQPTDLLMPYLTPINKQQVICYITEVSDATIVAETLVDAANGITQARRFDRQPLLGVIDCQVGTVFNLSIVTSPGRREFLYTPGNVDDRKYFEETLVDITSLRNDLNNDPLFRQAPDTDDGDTF
jgi:hypothetical protein